MACGITYGKWYSISKLDIHTNVLGKAICKGLFVTARWTGRYRAKAALNGKLNHKHTSKGQGGQALGRCASLFLTIKNMILVKTQKQDCLRLQYL